MPTNRRVYLDHAAAALPSAEQMRRVADALANTRFRMANPHSTHASGQSTADMVEATRSRILEHFGVSSEEYAVIFTANATAALKLVAECFDFLGVDDRRSVSSEEAPPELCCAEPLTSLHFSEFSNCPTMVLSRGDAHTSVVGMRSLAACRRVLLVNDVDTLEAVLDGMAGVVTTKNAEAALTPRCRHLLTLPSMSNFCGRKYAVGRLVEKVRKKLGDAWSVCVDAAASVGVEPTDLRVQMASPDFVALSFYKMFGYPTGLGALLVHHRRGAADWLRKRYFGGGTVNFASNSEPLVDFRADVSQRFEDGTLDYYSIFALRHGFDDLQRFGGMAEIARHDAILALRTARFLRAAHHWNGRPVATLYGTGWRRYFDDAAEKEGADEPDPDALIRLQGPIVNFNLLRDDGSFVGYVEVEKMADLFGVDLRCGCFCNQGACAAHLRLDAATLRHNFQMGKKCGDGMDVSDEGRPLGSVRVSFGRTSTEEDFHVFRQLIESCFISTNAPALTLSATPPTVEGGGAAPYAVARLTHILFYPVKSCAAVDVKRWPVATDGLLHDRRWAVASATGVALTQKRFPALCSIVPQIDRDGKRLVLVDRRGLAEPLEIDLERASEANASETKICEDLRLDRLRPIDYGGAAAADWLAGLHPTLANCRLIGLPSPSQPSSSPSSAATRRQNFSNQANYLLVTRHSLERVATCSGLDYASALRRFRPNFVIEFCDEAAEPFDEDSIEELYIGSVRFKVTGQCTRCQMICIDQESGDRSPTMLIALRDLQRHRRLRPASGDFKLTFGVYLDRVWDNCFSGYRPELTVGSMVRVARQTSTEQLEPLNEDEL